MKSLEVTISGSYKTSSGEIVDFENVKGFIPFVDDEHAKMHVRSRYATEWIRNLKDRNGDKVYSNRIDTMRQVFIDDIKQDDTKFSFVGKNIKDMSYDELQDLATSKDIRRIPLPKSLSGVDLREMRTQAYLGYSDKCLGVNINVNNPLPQHSSKVGDRLTFDFAKLPDLFVEDSEARVDLSQKVTNDEMIDMEMKPMNEAETPKSHLTLADLKNIADTKNISYHHKIGFDKLYGMLFA